MPDLDDFLERLSRVAADLEQQSRKESDKLTKAAMRAVASQIRESLPPVPATTDPDARPVNEAAVRKATQ